MCLSAGLVIYVCSFILSGCDIIGPEPVWESGCQTFLEYSTQDLASVCERDPLPPASGKIQALFRVSEVNEAARGLMGALFKLYH